MLQTDRTLPTTVLCCSLTESGVTEGLSRVRNRAEASDAADDGETTTLSKRESSHDYD